MRRCILLTATIFPACIEDADVAIEGLLAVAHVHLVVSATGPQREVAARGRLHRMFGHVASK
eukprot:657944-Prymnesium_polylepis.1